MMRQGDPIMAARKSLTINREISWLSFNQRVLQEAADPDVPLLERLKFLGISSSNLDEFFRVRVSSYQRMVDAGVFPDSVYGGTPRKVLKDIHRVVMSQREDFDRVFTSLERELGEHNIYIINERELSPGQEQFVAEYFHERVRPALVPVMLDTVPSFPDLKNQTIYLAVRFLRKGKSGSVNYALIELPVDELPRFVALPRVGDGNYVIMLDDIIRYGLSSVFAVFDPADIGAYTIKITRDAELDIDDDVTLSTVDKISKSLRQRTTGSPVRMVYDREIPEDLLNFILRNANLTKLDNIIPGGRYHNARDFMKFPAVGDASLRYGDDGGLPHPAIAGASSVLQAVRQRDVLLHFPYHTFNHIIDLLREAAIDPKVRSIRMTLYRVAENSRVINALINAIRNGKRVTVQLELQARFDEEHNIYWTRRLEEEGARLLSGVADLKVHAKLCLISRREGKKNNYYAVVGTGNFNEDTGAVYADHALLTADPRITGEVRRVFDFLKSNYKTYNYKHLIVSPFHTRKKLEKMIRREVKHAKAGKNAYIHVKLNSLVDRSMIERLYTASRAGVEVKLVVRGICSLVPGIKGMSENIQATSIVDKYLEHSRIFFFCNDGADDCFISSADWMVRNLDSRVEVTCPIYDDALRAELRRYLEIQFQDNVKARVINQAQDNEQRSSNGGEPVRSQVAIYEWLREVAVDGG
jgi:polyphosphate kinase